jgi:hypothetical protein
VTPCDTVDLDGCIICRLLDHLLAEMDPAAHDDHLRYAQLERIAEMALRRR